MNKPKTRTIRVDPGSFVQEPFIECPKCHEKAYGILEVYSSHFQRRCQKCWFESDKHHTGQYYLPPLQKKILYLDQFVISSFMKSLNKASKSHGKIDPVWKRLFTKIDLLGHLQLITCPSSIIHENESVMMRDMFESMRTMYNQLSSGESFRHHTSIQNDQIAAAFSAWLSGKKSAEYDFSQRGGIPREINHWVKGYYITVTKTISQKTINALLADRNADHEQMNEVWADWIKVKKYDADDYYNRQFRNFKYFYLETYIDWFKKCLVAMAGGSAFDESIIFHPPAVGLITAFKRSLEERGHTDTAAFEKLKEFFDSEICNSVPFLRIKTTFFKQLYLRASRGRKRAPTQGMMNDIDMVSTYLPFCDAAFIDRECHSLLVESEMQKVMGQFKTRIFSMSNLSEFEAYLDQIEQSQSSEHKLAVKNLYGEGGPKPYLTIYDDK